MHIFVFSKTPNSILDYTVDWTEWLGTDTISSSSWTFPAGITKVSDSTTTTSTTVWVSGGTSGLNYDLKNIITTVGGRTEVRVITLLVRNASNVRYLIPQLRLIIGDIDSSSYRYLDDWLEISLLLSVKTIGGKWMNNKYLVDTSDQVTRNPNSTFLLPEPPTIQYQDEKAILLMAAIITLEGSLENSAWDFASWRDNEISYSNLESARSRDAILTRLWNELTGVIKPPTKRLAEAKKGDLPGYKPLEGNKFEIGDMT